MQIGFTDEEIVRMCAVRMAHERTMLDVGYDRLFEKQLKKAERDIQDYTPAFLRRVFSSFIHHAIPQVNVEERSFLEILEAANGMVTAPFMNLKEGDVVSTFFGLAKVVTWTEALEDPSVEFNEDHVPVKFEASAEHAGTYGAVPANQVSRLVRNGTRAVTTEEIVRQKKMSRTSPRKKKRA